MTAHAILLTVACGLSTVPVVRATAQSLGGGLATIDGSAGGATRADAVGLGPIVSISGVTLGWQGSAAYTTPAEAVGLSGFATEGARLDLATKGAGVWLGIAFMPITRTSGGSALVGTSLGAGPVTAQPADALDWRFSAPAAAHGIDAGGWLKGWGVTISAEVAQSSASIAVPTITQSSLGGGIFSADSVSAPPPTATRSAADYRLVSAAITTRLSAVWTSRSGRIDLGAESGVVAHSSVRGIGWFSTSAAFWATPQLAVVASGGAQAVAATLRAGLETQHFAQLGLRVTTRRKAIPSRADGANAGSTARVRLRPSGADTFVLVVEAPHAHQVEIRGDLTGWRPTALERKAADRWELAQPPLTRGIYHLDVRVDGGEWRVPSGASQANDDFGGVGGLLIVEP